MITPVTDLTWKEAVAAVDGLALVDVWASWCGPCRLFWPVLERFTEVSGVPVFGLDADTSPSTLQEYEIMGIPTLLVFQKGKLVAKINGALSYPQLLAALEPFKPADK